jgi:hypothetical protein
VATAGSSPRYEATSAERSVSSAADPSRTIRPSTITAARLQILSAMTVFCSTRSNGVRVAICASAAKSDRAIFGASPSDGSSSSNSRGPATRARPIATICCSPPESAPPTRRRIGASAGNRS